MESLSIEDAYLFTPRIHSDRRGQLHEALRTSDVESAIGHPLTIAQANCVVSEKNVIRGVHFAEAPPGQAKYVSCLAGAVFDVVVDLRTGSPTFGRWQGAILDDRHFRSLYIGEGLGHALLSLTDRSVVHYLCSQPFRAAREHTVHPLDPDLGIDWPGDGDYILSDRDAAAPSLAEAMAAGILADHATCRDAGLSA
jgi:dTDP-4-dehydrorhamnose 3,5-epimerase